MIYTHQLSIMLNVGISIDRALAFLGHGSEKKLNAVFTQCARLVCGGKSLSQAMAEHPRVFPNLYVALVSVGEHSGALVQVLSSLSMDMEKRDKTRRQVTAALAYPAVLSLVCGSLLGLLLLYVVPAMQPIFSQLGIPLPWLTRAVLGLTELLRNPAVFLVLLLLGLSFGVLIHQLLEAEPNSPMRMWVDAKLLKVPVLGRLLRLEIGGRLCGTLGLLVGSGLTLDRSLLEAGRAAGNFWMTQQIKLVQTDLINGSSFASAAAKHGIFPRTALALIRNAEETGKLGETLRRAGLMIDEEVEDACATMAALAEPLVMAATSIMVGIVSLATLLPWIRLLSELF